MNFLNEWKKRHYEDGTVNSNYKPRKIFLYSKQRQCLKMVQTLEIDH